MTEIKNHCFTISINERNRSGIYKITDEKGRVYIGSSNDILMRGYSHRSKLKKGIHYSKELQKSYDENNNLVLTPLFLCAIDDLNFWEQKSIDVYQPEFNTLKFSDSSLGFRHSKKSIVRLEKAAQERAKDKNWREGVSKTWFKKGCKKNPNSLDVREIVHLAKEKNSKKVIVENVETGEKLTFDSILLASIYVKGPGRACVSHRLCGRVKANYKGYSFKYAV